METIEASYSLTFTCMLETTSLSMHATTSTTTNLSSLKLAEAVQYFTFVV